MQKITAIVRPNMIDDVIYALHRVDDFPGATMTDVRGIGHTQHQRMKEAHGRQSWTYPTSIRVEIVCPDNLVESLVEVIGKSAHTGRPGDGQVFVSPVDFAVRISTRERMVDHM